MQAKAKLRVGQVIQHKLFDYRGVIVDVDPTFQRSEEWYEAMARTRPPKDKPWYHVLVHDAVHMTYVAERNLEPDETGEPVNHPALDEFFDAFRDGAYVCERSMN
ncbi:MAG: heat shock protein HspQ [Alphaproteobacteria bacterium]